jgi:hypothetical protein
MELQIDQNSSYRVEVSGWDSRENFFVEKTLLEWGREEKKEISLQAPLEEGCVVFVRLLQPNANANNFPIAYQAIRVAPRDSRGSMKIRLAQLRPRASFKETVRLLGEAAARVA